MCERDMVLDWMVVLLNRTPVDEDFPEDDRVTWNMLKEWLIGISCNVAFEHKGWSFDILNSRILVREPDVTFGIFDTEDNMWIGRNEPNKPQSENKPLRFGDEDVASLWARIYDYMLDYQPGRLRATVYEPAVRIFDRPEIKDPDTLRIIQRLEEGAIL